MKNIEMSALNCHRYLSIHRGKEHIKVLQYRYFCNLFETDRFRFSRNFDSNIFLKFILFNIRSLIQAKFFNNNMLKILI